MNQFDNNQKGTPQPSPDVPRKDGGTERVPEKLGGEMPPMEKGAKSGDKSGDKSDNTSAQQIPTKSVDKKKKDDAPPKKNPEENKPEETQVETQQDEKPSSDEQVIAPSGGSIPDTKNPSKDSGDEAAEGEKKKANPSGNPLIDVALLRTLDRDSARAKGHKLPSVLHPGERPKKSAQDEIDAASKEIAEDRAARAQKEVEEEIKKGESPKASEEPTPKRQKDAFDWNGIPVGVRGAKDAGKSTDTQEKEKPKTSLFESIKRLKQEYVSKSVTPIRTYEEDAARSMRKNKASVTKIAAAGRAQKPAPAQSQKKKDVWTLKRVLASIAILLLATFSVVAILTGIIFPTTSTPVDGVDKSTLLFSEEAVYLDVTNRSARYFQAAAGDIFEGELELGTFTQIVPYESVEEDKEERLSIDNFFLLLGTRVPPPLVRSLGTDYALAVHSFNGNEGVLVTDVESFDQAFAGMLSWEESMEIDLEFMTLGKSTFTGTSTESIPGTRSGEFIDRLIQNRDTRILYDNQGNVKLLYSFPNSQTLVITTNRDTFIRTLDRLNSANFAR